jgi:hypothetical protein
MNMAELFITETGQRLRVHLRNACKGHPCCIHDPSAHPLNTAPLHWRVEREVMERLCEHDIGHPDPDHLAHVKRLYGSERAWVDAVHGCDGCCSQ